MKIAVMGAGGIGGYVGGRLAEAGHDVTLIARGAHLAALQENGLRLDTPDGPVHLPDIVATESPADVGPVDLILFTVKLADADAAARALAPMMGPKTRILTLQNGIDSKAMIERHTGPGTVSAGVIYLVGYIRAPGVIWYPGGLHMISADPMAGDPVLAELIATNERLTELDIVASDDPDQVVWRKFVSLSAVSGITSLTRSCIGRVLEVPQSREFLRALSVENIAVARAAGVDFPDGLTEMLFANLQGQPYEMKSSMLVDIENGKPTELAWLSGRIVDLADQHGVEVPANRAVVAAVAPVADGAAKD